MVDEVVVSEGVLVTTVCLGCGTDFRTRVGYIQHLRKGALSYPLLCPDECRRQQSRGACKRDVDPGLGSPIMRLAPVETSVRDLLLGILGFVPGVCFVKCGYKLRDGSGSCMCFWSACDGSS